MESRTVSATQLTREILAASPIWRYAVGHLPLMGVARASPLDMSAWSLATHESVRRWALGEQDVMPSVLLAYMTQFEEPR